MRLLSNIMSVAMMAVVLFLGVSMPTMPDLDDSDDNVGAAAVMPQAPRKSTSEVAAKRRVHGVARTRQPKVLVVVEDAAPAAIAPALLALTQISPPLRP